MNRAIALGENALGTAAPNPMVGCCIVHNDTIIGEGFTSSFGGSHAEVNAVNSVKNKALLKEATLYVTLEPCSHFGKTPPCSDLIIEKNIQNVVIGIQDPNPKVAGKGISKLKKAGIEVKVGVLEEKCRNHHKRFLCAQEKKRPYVILKWAQSADGFIAPPKLNRDNDPKPYWITNAYSKQLVHQWRSQEQAILVGTQTVLDDNPKLTTRKWSGKSPTRVVLDRNLKIPRNYHVFDGSVKTLVFTEKEATTNNENLIFETIDFNEDLTKQLLHSLHRHEISSLIIEGGSRTLQTFIDNDHWDEARIFKGATTFNGGIKAPNISGKVLSSTSIQSDTLTILQHD